ncbi:MAG: NAD(P)-dependent oxidoreductase [Bdellovibrionota bacterium]
MSKVPTSLRLELASQLNGLHLFVSGGTGFFGKSLLDFLIHLDRNHETSFKVSILSRDPTLFLKNNPKYQNIKFINFYVGEVQNFTFPNIKCSHLLHLATPASVKLNIENPQLMAETIAQGTSRMLEFAKTCSAKTFLFASSGAVYGPHSEKTLLSENQTCSVMPLESAYAKAKLLAEEEVLKFTKQNSIQSQIARCFAFVGPHLDPNGSFAISNFIRDALNNKEIVLSGDGSAVRSYLYSEDLAAWLLKLLFNSRSGAIYNVGSPNALSILDLAQKVKTLLNPNLKIKVLGQANLSGQTSYYVPSITLIQKELGLDVWTSLEEAIINTANYYKKN